MIYNYYSFYYCN